MKNQSVKQQIPCVIENGIVYSIKDIYRIVRDMGHVKYTELINEEATITGEGYIMSVVANDQSATVIANRRIYLNVCGFDYLQIKTQSIEEVHFDLVDSYRTLRLTPISDHANINHLDEKTDRYEDFPHLTEGDFAEINLDDDDDILDGE